MWVLSHSGIKGNEEVDLLSNQAISSAESTAIKSLTYKDLSRMINRISVQQWQSKWDSEINQVISENKLNNI
ncbi:RNase H domain-containing protein [Aphis craccivora]|uniref:RNase H domain-containing protein n=1 Tax=Aphis craccivora TaxID=307492 RepID=A0A6G0Z1L3_APHCR|nr:RNase H domain-containing protein [Aphis craccivora]